jgi:hypothetical protein
VIEQGPVGIESYDQVQVRLFTGVGSCHGAEDADVVGPVPTRDGQDGFAVLLQVLLGDHDHLFWVR